MLKVIDSKVVFENSNGKTYPVIQFKQGVAILQKNALFNPEECYIVVKGFNPSQDSWGSGIYDLTLEEAKKIFNEYKSIEEIMMTN